MANGRFAQEYRKGAVNGASPLQLVVMLYDGSLRFMEVGKDAMEHKDLVRQNTSLQKAQRIITELMACLDMQQGGDIAKNLLSIYSYVLNELVTANMADDPSAIERCMKIMSGLRESWVQIERSTREQNIGAPLAA